MKSTDEKGGSGMNEVVKSHRLNTAIQNLSLAEIRLIQLAIIDAREYQKGLSADIPLTLDAIRYSEAFGVCRQTAYEVLQDAEKNLFERRFTFLDERDNQPVKSRWISQAKYNRGEGRIEIMFTPAVVKEITRLGGDSGFFTQYSLEQVSALGSIYSMRLYELLTQWRKAKQTPVFELETFRGQMGLEVGEYKAMCDFKKRVLDLAVNEINKKTDLTVSYNQKKKGKNISGFKFTVKDKAKPKTTEPKIQNGRDINTADMFTVEGLSDKQLGRIVRNERFVADYNDLVSSTSPAGQDMSAWEFEMVNRLKRDPSQFKKHPIREYL